MIAELKKDGTLELEIRREFPFPRDLVFETWINEEHLSRWMGPTENITMAVVEVDAREGGHYRLGFQENGEPLKIVHGVYETIRRPEKLVFTWIWEPPMPDAGIETLVTVEFIETPGGTDIILKHERFVSKEVCELHYQGWSGTFDKLENRLPQIAKQEKIK
jgi:uncharacterized protein YndB with AHSA1/START domain